MLKRLLPLATALAVVLMLLPPFADAALAASSVTVTQASANVRSAPSLSAPVVLTVYSGDTVVVTGTVQGDAAGGTRTWYRTRSGYYISAAVVSASGQTASAAGGRAGRWIEVDLSSQVARAMNGNQVVFSVPVSTGKNGWETPAGTFTILRKTPSTNMNSATIGIPPGSPGYYYAPNVPWTMYFTNRGHALHGNYWANPSVFGSQRTSHGCVGMATPNAEAFYDFAGVGTTVSIHY